MMYNRHIGTRVVRALKAYPIVLLSGARKTGKSTLVQQVAEHNLYTYINFADIQAVIDAHDDPAGFLHGLHKPIVFDEIQKVPGLLTYIMQDIKAHQMPGRYLLTSSIDPHLLLKQYPELSTYLQVIPMYPLSQGELSNQYDAWIDAVFNDTQFVDESFYKLNPEQVMHRVFTGGFPSVQEVTPEQRHGWFNNYVVSIINNELAQLMHLDDVTLSARMLKSIAHQSRQFNGTEVARQLHVPLTTLNRHMELLRSLLIVQKQEAGAYSNMRLAKAPRMQLLDSGFLNWITKKTHQHVDVPHVLKSFIYMELCKQISWNVTPVNIYHVRSRNGITVDHVLKRYDGMTVGIVVKAGLHISQKDTKGLRYLQDKLGTRFKRGVVFYFGTEVIPLEPKIVALPIATLWETVSPHYPSRL